MLCNFMSGLVSCTENLAMNREVTRSVKDKRKPKARSMKMDVKEMWYEILNGFYWFYYHKCRKFLDKLSNYQLLKKDSNLSN
jgi:hypothetical protein